jgi:hypothetical protein
LSFIEGPRKRIYWDIETFDFNDHKVIPMFDRASSEVSCIGIVVHDLTDGSVDKILLYVDRKYSLTGIDQSITLQRFRYEHEMCRYFFYWL